MAKKKSLFISIGVIISVLLIGCIFIVINKKEDNLEKDYEEFIFSTNDEANDVKTVSNGYEITLNNYYALNLYDYIDDEEEYKNVMIKGFSLDNKESILDIENLTRTANCMQDKKYPKIVLNDIVIEEFSHEACYLVFPAEIFIIENKYLGILYNNHENLENTLVIYNNKGNREYIRDITGFDLTHFTFKDYEEDDSNYYINEYKLVKKNGEIADVLIKKGKEQFCDMINAIGVCEE